MHNDIPNDAYAIIIGAMKCGTSSLYSNLALHPEICPARTKEPEFFSQHQGHGLRVANYNDLWSFDKSKHKYALEGSTGYTKYPAERDVAKRIFDYGIRPKLIYVVRHPFERIISDYNFMQRFMTQDDWRRLRIDEPQFVHTTDYFMQLEQYRQYFPMQDILVLDFDELRDKPAQAVRRAGGFLGLSSKYFPEEYDVVNAGYSSQLELNLDRWKIGPALSRLPKPIKQFGRKLLRTVSSAPEKRVLTDAEKEMFHNQLKDGMRMFHSTYGFDVRKWGFDI